MLSSWNNFTFQQDGAPSQKSKYSGLPCSADNRLFRNSLSHQTDSLDLNPVVYSIFDALQQLVYCQKIKDIDHRLREAYFISVMFYLEKVSGVEVISLTSC